jgi:hypothetical protein
MRGSTRLRARSRTPERPSSALGQWREPDKTGYAFGMHTLLVVIICVVVIPPLAYFRWKSITAAQQAGRNWRRRHDAHKNQAGP